MTAPFDAWLEEGMRSGWCSHAVCGAHHHMPVTAAERAALNEGLDPCYPALRLYPPTGHRLEEIE